MKIKASLVFFLLISPAVLSQKATDQDMVDSALHAYFRTSSDDVSEMRSMINERTQEMISLSREHDSSEIYITIIFSNGMTADEVDEFARRHQFEIANVQAKAAAGNEGQVYTMGIGTQKLSMFSGSNAEKLRKATGSMQFALLRTYEAVEASDEQLSDNMMEVISEPLIKFYILEGVAQVRNLSELSTDERVLEMIPDFEGTKLDSFQAEKRAVERFNANVIMRVENVPFEDGVPDSIPESLIINRGAFPSQHAIEALEEAARRQRNE